MVVEGALDDWLKQLLKGTENAIGYDYNAAVTFMQPDRVV